MRSVKSVAAAVFWAAVVFLFTYRLGTNALGNWDEAWYADVSRTMAQTGDLLAPRWNYGMFFDKPPLYYWLSAGCYRFLGDTEVSARLPSAVAGIASVVAVAAIVAAATGSTAAAGIAAVALATMPGYVSRVRTGNLDGLFAAWIILSCGVWFWCLAGRFRRRWWILGIVLSLGFLTKGAGAFSFLALAVPYSLVARRFRRDAAGYALSVGMAVVVATVWTGIMQLRFGQPFTDAFMANQAGKLSGTWSVWRNFTLDFVRFAVSGMKLWTIPVIAAVPFAAYRFRRKAAVLVPVYAAVFLLAISFSVNKSNWFLVPLYPFAAASLGLAAAGILSKGRTAVWGPVALAAAVVMGGLQVWHYRTEFYPPDVGRSQTNISRLARSVTREGDTLYLTQYYYPATAYYSRRRTLSVYSDRQDRLSWWILPVSAWPGIIAGERVYVITTDDDILRLSDVFATPSARFAEIGREGGMVLLKKL